MKNQLMGAHGPFVSRGFVYVAQMAITCLLMVLALSGPAKAQVQNTGFTYISSGTTLYVQSSFVNSSTATYQNYGNAYLTGDFTNHQASMAAGTGTHYFVGTSLQNITGTQPSYFYNATFNNSNNVQLGTNVSIDGLATITSGLLSINGNTLALNGATSFTGSLQGSPTSKLTIGGTGGGSAGIKFNAAANDSMLHTLTLDRTGASAGLTMNSNLGIIKQLVLTNGAFDISNKILTLKSTSILNTAIVAVVGSGASITGNTTVERFIPRYASTYGASTGNKAYRDIAPGVVPARNLFYNWQEGGTNNNGYGTHITGKVGTVGTVDATTGFDNTNSGIPSMYSYNVTSTSNGSWDVLTSTNQSSNILSPFKGYRISIRGNRTHDLSYDIPSMSTTVTLRTTGQLITGTVTYATTGITASTGSTTAIQLAKNTNNFTMIGNPYVCPIDWLSIVGNASNSNIKPSYTVFDPNIGTSGGYVAYNSTTGSSNPTGSQINRYIQPGQAFFVQNLAAGTQLVIREADKQPLQDASTLMNVFGSGPSTITPRIQFVLLRSISGNPVNMDGAVIHFDNSYSKATGPEDASKISNTADNMGINNNLQSGQYSIEGRPEPNATDSIGIRLTTLTAGAPYTLSIDLTNFTQSPLDVYLKDNFLNSQVLLFSGSVTQYPFTTSTNAGSYTGRFTIKFQQPATVLPISFILIKAKSGADGKRVLGNAAAEQKHLGV